MAEKNSVDLDSDRRSIVGTRIFDAPRTLVFSAFTDPKHLARWWGPDGFSITTSAFDFRAGGTWRFVMHGPDGRDYQNRVTFVEIVKDQRLFYRHGGDDDVEPISFETTVTFEDYGQNKTRVVWHGRFPSQQERDRVVREYGADKGLVQTMSRLADYLIELKNL